MKNYDGEIITIKLNKYIPCLSFNNNNYFIKFMIEDNINVINTVLINNKYYNINNTVNNINKIINDNINNEDYYTYIYNGLHLKRLGDTFQVDYFINNELLIFQTIDFYCWLYASIHIVNQNKLKIIILGKKLIGFNYKKKLIVIDKINNTFYDHVKNIIIKNINIGGNLKIEKSINLFQSKIYNKRMTDVKSIELIAQINNYFDNTYNNTFISSVESQIEFYKLYNKLKNYLKNNTNNYFYEIYKIFDLLILINDTDNDKHINPLYHKQIYDILDNISINNYFLIIKKLYNKIYESNKDNIIFHKKGRLIINIINNLWMYIDYLEASLDNIYIVKLLHRDCAYIKAIYDNYYEDENNIKSPNIAFTNYNWIEGNPNMIEYNQIKLYEKQKSQEKFILLKGRERYNMARDISNKETELYNKYKAFEPLTKVCSSSNIKEILEFYKEEYKLHKLQNYFNERDNLKELYESQKIKYDDYDKQLYNLQYKYFETVNTIIGDSVRYYLKSINN
jgi:hypothetical protein